MGISFRFAADCRSDQDLCDRNARCERRGQDYVCVCQQGFSGDGYRCYGISPPPSAPSLISPSYALSPVPYHCFVNVVCLICLQLSCQGKISWSWLRNNRFSEFLSIRQNEAVSSCRCPVNSQSLSPWTATNSSSTGLM